jgi:hypothetical protein
VGVLERAVLTLPRRICRWRNCRCHGKQVPQTWDAPLSVEALPRDRLGSSADPRRQLALTPIAPAHALSPSGGLQDSQAHKLMPKLAVLDRRDQPESQLRLGSTPLLRLKLRGREEGDPLSTPHRLPSARHFRVSTQPGTGQSSGAGSTCGLSSLFLQSPQYLESRRAGHRPTGSGHPPGYAASESVGPWLPSRPDLVAPKASQARSLPATRLPS